ncbi:MAG: hypothetical protein KGH94_01235 [Candidatus Micrarchaeota archaeon]|nr:hypothetical protein [Candidatus Micrarchaeota archaeon]
MQAVAPAKRPQNSESNGERSSLYSKFNSELRIALMENAISSPVSLRGSAPGAVELKAAESLLKQAFQKSRGILADLQSRIEKDDEQKAVNGLLIEERDDQVRKHESITAAAELLKSIYLLDDRQGRAADVQRYFGLNGAAVPGNVHIRAN